MAFTEHRIATADGPVLHVREYAALGPGLPVVCLHGLTRNSRDFEAVAPRIAALGRRTVAIDARGRGRSDNDPDVGRYRPDVYAGDVLAVLDRLQISRAVFLGTSMGGIMTMIAAQTAPARIAAAVLNDIGPDLDPAGLRRIGSYVGQSPPFASWPEMVAAVKATQNVAYPDRDESFWTTFARRVGRERGDGRVEFAYDPAIARNFAKPPPAPTSLWPMFEALASRPVLVLRGALSDLLAPSGVAAMRAVKPDLEFAEIPDVGHAPTLEEPQAWGAITSFLSNVE